MGVTHSSDTGAGASALPTGTTSPSPAANQNDTVQDHIDSEHNHSNQTNFVCYICLRKFSVRRNLLKHVVCAYESCYSDHLDLLQQPIRDDTPPEFVPLLANLHEMARQAAVDCDGAPLTTLFEGGRDAQVKHEESKSWPGSDWKMALADSPSAFHGTSTTFGCESHGDHDQAKLPSNRPSKRLHTKRMRPEQASREQASRDDENEFPEPDYAQAYEDVPALDKTCLVVLLPLSLQCFLFLKNSVSRSRLICSRPLLRPYTPALSEYSPNLNLFFSLFCQSHILTLTCRFQSDNPEEALYSMDNPAMFMKIGPSEFVLQGLVPGGETSGEDGDSSGLREYLLLHLIQTMVVNGMVSYQNRTTRAVNGMVAYRNHFLLLL
jgi:hypothetical protein